MIVVEDRSAEANALTRKYGLRMIVPDSGRTWCVNYEEIQKIPPDSMQLGDVLIVRNPPGTGVMFMQVVAPHGDAWELKSLDMEAGN